MGLMVGLSIKQIFGGLFIRLQKISIGGLVVKLAVAICFRLIRLAPGSIPGRCNYLFAVLRLWLRVFWWDERLGHVAYTASCTATLAHRHTNPRVFESRHLCLATRVHFRATSACYNALAHRTLE
jgi:hypothetical protein